MMIPFFIALQILLFFFMVLHDWVELRPFTDLEALKRAHSKRERLLGSAINGGLVLVPLLLSLCYPELGAPLWVRWTAALIYGLLTVGTVTAWWVPYFGGGYWIHGNGAGFEEYKNTHSFLPKRGENVTPNTLHLILHLQVWICFGLSIYWLMG